VERRRTGEAEEIEAFLVAIRNVGDRRAFERIPCSLAVRVTVAGRGVAGLPHDISLGGCRFGAAPPARCGEQVTLAVPGGMTIACRVVAVGADATRLQFALDEATLRTVRALLPAQPTTPHWPR